MPLIGVFKMLHVMLFLLAVAFSSAFRTLQLLTQGQLTAAPFTTPNYEISQLSKRWRAERNLWLSAFAFTMWAVLAAFYREMARRIRAEERLVEFEASDFTNTMDTTRDVSREVSSRPNLISPRMVTSASPASSPVKAPRPSRPPAVPATGQQAAPEVELTPAEALVKKDL